MRFSLRMGAICIIRRILAWKFFRGFNSEKRWYFTCATSFTVLAKLITLKDFVLSDCYLLDWFIVSYDSANKQKQYKDPSWKK